MGNSVAVPSLMFFTLAVVVILAIGLLVWHLRKPSNRHPMRGQRERNIGEIERGEPPQK